MDKVYMLLWAIWITKVAMIYTEWYFILAIAATLVRECITGDEHPSEILSILPEIKCQ